MSAPTTTFYPDPKCRTKVHDVIDALTYKENWQFAVHVDIHKDKVSVRMWFSAPDAKGRAKGEIYIQRDVEFTGDEDYDEIKGKIYEGIQHLELHEVDEWLKFDGLPYRGAH